MLNQFIPRWEEKKLRRKYAASLTCYVRELLFANILLALGLASLPIPELRKSRDHVYINSAHRKFSLFYPITVLTRRALLASIEFPPHKQFMATQ